MKGYDKDFARRLQLNQLILGNKYWILPVDDKGYEDFMPVGRGVPSNDWCGLHRGFLGCKNVEGHKGIIFKGSDCTNKVFVRNQHFWCKKSSCPVCFISGWSVRGAKVITDRLDEAVRRNLGVVEHIVVSLCKDDYDLFYKASRCKALDSLVACNVSGGCMIFHGFRIDRRRAVLAWSPHYHILGFVRGGYDGCRHCKGGDCYLCDGFLGAAYRLYRKNGYIVRVLDERETVFGSAWYQLNHASIKLGMKRFHVVSWFGGCGYSKFKTVKSISVVPCPLCSEVMDRVYHSGKHNIVKNLGHARYVSSFLDDELDESGNPNYVDG